jgi:hypothetical protein
VCRQGLRTSQSASVPWHSAEERESEADMDATAPYPAEPPHDSPTAPGRAAALSERISGFFASRLSITITLVLLVLAGLPVAVWLDLRNMSERALTEQANELSSTIDSIRNYYASRVVGRVLADGEKTHVLPNYAEVPGAIPIPATLSLELGDLINRNNGNTQFRFSRTILSRIVHPTRSTISSEGRLKACGKIRIRACTRFQVRFSTAASGWLPRSSWRPPA